MSRHEGVSCDLCLKSNFRGRRYKCLMCYDYDLCANCYEEGATTTRHSTDHPMQCILTVSDFELYYGGETLGVEHPRSYTCPYCKEMGFSDSGLFDHVTVEHTDTGLDVVCPMCAAVPGGEPNLVTEDFAGHLNVEHRNGSRDLISFLDEPSSIRHGGVRRAPHSGRSIGGPRSRRSNMHFGSGSSTLAALSPAAREAADPIAELLSQLSGVRRGQNPPSQLQQLQMQIQLERQQVTAARQQLERLPRRHTVVNPSTVPVSHSQAGLASSVLNGREISISSAPLQMAAAAASQQSLQNQANQSQFLLSRFMTPSLQDTEQILLENNRADRSQFVQHLLLSTLSNLQIVHESENDSTPTNEGHGIVDPPQASNATDDNTITQSSELPHQQSQSDRVNTKKPAVTQKPVPERRSRPPASQAQVKGRELKASSMSSKELPDSR
ncbi:E3 ubiquitin-protein ligase KCMF1-like [Bradysia coprophila]|uniref:E3 ubiquitin-protein ligase KCMF1-like n=1 Tax=Bradysia coprophila TaxID=38358 RepID=UPI00187D92FF|nr:E3 ubiquitin-protein ligase KCMF1-like [Bradysia coprophila]